jgi:peptidoglycan/LPS O-acetylase OafA/YrhL
MENPTSQASRSISLDVMRIFAAFWVLLYHWSGDSGFIPQLVRPLHSIHFHGIFLFIANRGFAGVDIFFVLRGAVIAKTRQERTWKKFGVARLIRLYPVYLFSSILGLLILPFTQKDFFLKSTVISLTGLQYWVGGQSVIGTSWTLQFEIEFYLFVAAFIAYQHFKPELSDVVAVNVWAIACVLLYRDSNEIINLLSIGGFAPYFFLGFALRRSSNLMEFRRWSPTIVIGSVLVGKKIIERIDGLYSPHKHSILVIILLATIELVILFGPRLDRLIKNARVLALVSTLALMTYPIYLLHEQLGLSIISLLENNAISTSFAYLIVFVLLMTLSFVITTFLEPKLKHVLYNWFK